MCGCHSHFMLDANWQGKAPILHPIPIQWAHSLVFQSWHCEDPCFLFYSPSPTMKPPSPLNFIPKPLTTTIPLMQFYNNSCKSGPNFKRVSKLEPHAAKFPVTKTSCRQIPLVAIAATNSQLDSGVFQGSPDRLEAIEGDIEKVRYSL